MFQNLFPIHLSNSVLDHGYQQLALVLPPKIYAFILEAPADDISALIKRINETVVPLFPSRGTSLTTDYIKVDYEAPFRHYAEDAYTFSLYDATNSNCNSGFNSKLLLPAFQQLCLFRLLMTEVQRRLYEENPLFELAECLHDNMCTKSKQYENKGCECGFHDRTWALIHHNPSLPENWYTKAENLRDKYGAIEDVKRAVQIMKDLKS